MACHFICGKALRRLTALLRLCRSICGKARLFRMRPGSLRLCRCPIDNREKGRHSREEDYCVDGEAELRRKSMGEAQTVLRLNNSYGLHRVSC